MHRRPKHRFDLEPLDTENVELLNAMEREEKYLIKLEQCPKLLNSATPWFQRGVSSAENESGEGSGGQDHGREAEEWQEAIKAGGRVQENDLGKKFIKTLLWRADARRICEII